MENVVPRHVLCVLGRWDSFDAVSTIVTGAGAPGFELDRQFSLLRPDTRMVNSFQASYDRVQPTMNDDDWGAIRSHSAVAYVLSPPARRDLAVAISARALLLTAALLQNGGVAAKADSCGIAHGRAHWLELSTRYAQSHTEHNQRATLYFSWVRRPILDDQTGSFYSCGMHLLGKPDIEIESSLDVHTAVKWIDLLGLYLVADQPKQSVADGEGFRLYDSGPRRVMRFEPCKRFDEDDFFFNPYGQIRLERSQ